MTGTLSDGLYDLPAGKIAAVVTSLQMLRPPDRAGERPSNVRLRHETAPRADWYRALFREVGTPWLWTSRLLLGDAALSAIIEDPAVDVFAVERDGRDVGLLELDFRVAGDCEIAFFGLVAAVTRRGLGRWLMDQALQRAWSRPIGRLWVHTCTLDHPAALPFYIASGFVPFHRQVEIMDDPRVLGLLPSEAAPQAPWL